MANLKELRLRINTVKNTRKITAAMAQIASARLRKAQNAVTAAQPYGERMSEVVAHLVAGIKPHDRAAAHPLLGARDVKAVMIIAMTADRGLCGGFNSNINRRVKNLLEETREAGKKVELTAVGKKASSFFRHYGEKLEGREHPAPTLETLVEQSKTLASAAIEAFQSKRVDEVVLVYNKFVSVLTQEATDLPLVPLVPAEVDGTVAEPTFEPDRGAILEHLVPVAEDVGFDVEQRPGDALGREAAAVDFGADTLDGDAVRSQGLEACLAARALALFLTLPPGSGRGSGWGRLRRRRGGALPRLAGAGSGGLVGCGAPCPSRCGAGTLGLTV